MTAPPSQVEIESKFLEVTQNNLKEMGIDWLLGQFSMPFGIRRLWRGRHTGTGAEHQCQFVSVLESRFNHRPYRGIKRHVWSGYSRKPFGHDRDLRECSR